MTFLSKRYYLFNQPLCTASAPYRDRDGTATANDYRQQKEKNTKHNNTLIPLLHVRNPYNVLW